jgi:SEC-C motif/Glycosyl transferase family 2
MTTLTASGLPAIARNAPCPCGSGRRFKECHGAAGAALTPAMLLMLLERRLARAPDDVASWRLVLPLVVEGRVADGDIGASLAIGDARPLRVAVVTAYCREDLAMLARCHGSVAAQTYPCRHIMVADGFARRELDGWDVLHLRLAHPSADYGDTPRAEGGAAAIAAGFDAIAFLDADNTLRPRHVESLVARAAASGAAWVQSARTLHLPDGRILPGMQSDDHAGHVDTNCMLLAGDALAMATAWRDFPRELAPIGDRVFARMLRARGLEALHTGALTVRYTVAEARYYASIGVAPPATARAPIALAPMARWYEALRDDEREALDRTLGFALAGLLAPVIAAADAPSGGSG